MRQLLKEAWNERSSRRTGIGCEAASIGASGQMAAKPQRPKLGGVDSAVVNGRLGFLAGETSLQVRKGHRCESGARSQQRPEVFRRETKEGPNRERAKRS